MREQSLRSYTARMAAILIAGFVFGMFLDKFIGFQPPTSTVEEGVAVLPGDEQGQIAEGEQIVFAQADVTPAGPFAGMSYQEVVEMYEGKRVQFGEECQSIPNYLTFKTGSEVMLDNRSAEKRVVYLDATGYTIAAYGWVVIPLATRDLPHTVSIDCAGLYNSGQILLQN